MSTKNVDLSFVANHEDCESTSRVVWRHASYKWRIKNFSQYPTQKTEYMRSPTFSCSSSTWALDLIPNGSNDENKGNVGLSLNKLSPQGMKYTKYKMGLKDWKNINRYEMNFERSFGSSASGWGWFYFIKREMLFEQCEELLPGDVLTVYCELSVYENLTDEETERVQQSLVNKKEDTGTSIVPKGVEILAKDMEVLWREKKHCDVNLQVDNETFPAHKWLLGVRSNVFAAMFEHDMEENRTNIITITDTDSAIVSDMLQYIYTGLNKIT